MEREELFLTSLNPNPIFYETKKERTPNLEAQAACFGEKQDKLVYSLINQ